MKHILVILLFLPAFVHADDAVRTHHLLPIVKFSQESIQIKDKRGNSWAINTDCSIDPDNITEFTIRDKVLREGTDVRIRDDKVCKIKRVSKV